MNKQDKIRKSLITLLLAVYALFLPHWAFSQQGQVSGVVKDASSGEVLAGVSVIVDGTAMTSTDEKGAFELTNISPDKIIAFSYLGYGRLTQRSAASMQIFLTALDGDALEEVVVVGYGTQKKATLTGAIEVVGKEVFENRAITNVALALQGQTPGLVVTRTSPRPGNEGLNLAIRGASSVNGSNPLIIIDGVPALNAYAFQNLNPDDIENVTILKDGSAAIYGSRAANGVILVTTKQGKGKVSVDYTGNFRFNTNGLVNYSPSMQEYAQIWLEANKEEVSPNWWIWGEENLNKMAQGHEGKYDLFNTDFYIYNANRIEEMFATRYSYQHNLSLAGGTEKSGYRISLGYADNQGNLATAYDGQKQYNARFNHNYQVSDKFKLESSVSIVNANTSMPSRGLGNILYSFDMPFYPAKNPLGQWLAPFNGIDGGAIRNAAATTSDAGRYDKYSLTGRADLRATYDIWNGISVEGLASVQNERFTHEHYVVPVQLYNWYGVPANYAYNTDGTNNAFAASAYSSFSQYYEALVRYNKTFHNLHNFSVMAGINAEKFSSQNLSANRVGFEDLGIYDISLGSAETQTNGGSKSLNGRYSYLSRLNYNYDEKYILELIGRMDGNSRFAKGYKFKNFGSVQAGWVFSKENFMSSLSDIVNFGKIRASYASTGNAADGLADFDYISLINTGTAVLGNPASQQTASGLANSGLISYTRTWETVLQQNIGMDLGFLQNRLTASFDVYEKRNIGMLVGVTYPSVLGGSAPRTNSGNFNTRGWEIVVGWKERKEDFSYNVSFNIGDANTLVKGVENADSFGAGRNGIVNGFPWQSWFLYKTDGFFKDQADVDAYYAKYGGSETLAAMSPDNPQTTLRPGDTKKVDVAGTGNITAVGNGASSLVYMGDGRPHYTYGFNLGGSWKGIDLNMFFQGHLKQNIMRDGYMAYPFRGIFTNQNPAFLGQTWTAENTDATFPRLTSYPARAAWNYANNDFMLQNSRYIRLKTLVLGYTLPKEFTQRAKLSRVRVYFSGNDLWEATTIKDGFDPETGQNATDGDSAGYPFARTWSFGVNIGF
ncbi:SusC/RagA family TonB-linked outer membrane protein [Sphingobacterium alkalisoli]|uniref:SusC/RagA family TonB-linked outer membrane protein n=1 Tax=Sphingobacterium alkalisoli TaxID=1874115 RepID=A0A4U0HC20_9SPHI|nr:SusC/RagA family TonB-linked outer membrane protein [Sphingobacterium alkalisoli]TJY68162.1 SusC/RagA family TonB-linked outer membrane protein [Sphingobacterium alkalisoli]GGH08596.1 SusC/RagA family TonB-linked outer membrane protein [Sphingobacterium alkalisoli]